MVSLHQLSCVILSWNRKPDLVTVLDKLRAITTVALEIIVVDNASSDGTVEMIQYRYPEVLCIPLPENVGISGWNSGIKRARHEYILLLDDDSFPEEEGLAEAMVYMISRPDCGILALKVYNERFQREETASFTPGPLRSFVGCGALLRSSLFSTIGGFNETLFLYEHEIDYAMRTWNAGYSVLYYPSATVRHIASSVHRQYAAGSATDCRRVYYTTRNVLYVLLIRFPLRRVLFRAFRISLGRSLAAVLHHCGRSAIRGVFSGWNAGLRERRSSVHLNAKTCRFYEYGNYAGGFFFEDSAYALRRPRGLRKRPS